MIDIPTLPIYSSNTGSFGSSRDLPALDLQFAADKMLTARRGPTPTFTRASTATFVGSNGLIQNAAINAPRFDHDPVTLASRGLLIEESRTNLCLQSANFGATWAVNNAMTVTNNTETAPDGTLTADSLNFDTNAGTRILQFAGSAAVHTFSVWLRAATNRTVVIATGAAGVAQVETICNVTTTWQRFSVVATNWPSGTASFNVRISNNASGTSGTIFAWGAQLEVGSFPTSYIPTTTTAVVRSADVCSITGSDFAGIYNQSEGTLLLSADEFRRGSSFPALLRIDNSASSIANRISIGSFGNRTGDAVPVEFLVSSDGVQQYSAIPTSTPSNFKAALAYRLDDIGASLNGTLAAADVPPSILPIGANTLRIGGVGIYISSVRYYRKRLSNAKLQSLTAP